MKKLLEGKYIFISYIEENKDVAHIIWDKLDALGAIPWAYTKNDDANRWRKEIVRSIKNSDIMVLIFSNKTDEKADKQIVREIGLASKNGLEIIPFMIDDISNIENEDLAYELEGINWIRKTEPIEKQITKLIERICKHYGITLEDSKLSNQNNEKKNVITGEEDYQKNINKTLWNNRLLRILLLIAVILILGIGVVKNIIDDNSKEKESNINPVMITSELPNLETSAKYSKDREEVENFLNNFYKAGESNSVIKAVTYYVDNVEEYFTFKNIGKDKIIEDKIKYYKKFPIRKYKLTEFEIVKQGLQNEILVYATINWKVKTASFEEKSGITTQVLKLIKKDGTFLVKSIRTIDRIVDKKTINEDFFVCYEKDIQSNGNIAYIGCLKSNISCREKNLKHFGKYNIKKDQEKAFDRCIKATPHPLYYTEVFNLNGTTDGFLALRDHPNGKLIQRLYNGDKLGVLEEDGKWLKVKVQDSHQVGWVFGKWVKKYKVLEKKDTTLRIGKSIDFGTIHAKIVSFGGVKTPECKFAISIDGQYFYYTKLHSNCVRLENSKKVKIVCNSNKSICKTRDEIIAFIKGSNNRTK